MVKADVELTHPDKLVQHVCVLYCCAIAYLINNPSDPQKGKNCFNECYRLAQSDLCNFKSGKKQKSGQYTESC